MNFDLGPDEIALRDSIRERFSTGSPREQRVDAASWRALGDAGVFSMRLPEDRGGVGLGMTQAVIVFQELGRALVPGPLVASHLAAGVVDGAATGERIIGLAEDALLIENQDAIDALILLDDEGIWQSGPYESETVNDPLDPLTPMALVKTLPRGERLGKAEDVKRWRLEGAALTAAMQTGIAGRVTELAVEYAKNRRQFGRVIGSFQAVKHLCADMLVRAEVARAAVDAAGVTLDDPAGDHRRAVASAKAVADEAAIKNAKAAIQVHGGMGFTWEVDLHLYLKRALVYATHFGSAGRHAETVAACL